MRRTPVFGDPKTDFNREEWDAYIAASMAIQNERGALSLARREGRDEGRDEGRHEGRHEGEINARRNTLLRLLVRAGIELTDDDRARIHACADTTTLDRWIDNIFGAKTAADVLT